MKMLSKIQGRKLSIAEMTQVLGGRGTHVCFSSDGGEYDVNIEGNTGDFLDKYENLDYCLKK